MIATRTILIKTVAGLCLTALAACKNPSKTMETAKPQSQPEMPQPTDIVFIPDAQLLKFIIDEGKADTNNDGKISYAEAQAVTSLESYKHLEPYKINNLTGLEAFANLTSLVLYPKASNQHTKTPTYGFDSIDLKPFKKLRDLRLHGSKIKTLNLNHNRQLQNVAVDHSFLLESVDVSQLDPSAVARFSIQPDSAHLFRTLYVPKGFVKPDSWNLPPETILVKK